MTTAVGSTTSSTSSTTSASSKMKSELGMDSNGFLKLFIAQLQYQDPLNPSDPTQMMSQLAQLTQVEQSYNTVTALNNLLTAQNNTAAMSAVSLIGGTITAAGSENYFDGTNATSLKYSMPAATTSGTLSVLDASGNTVRTVDLGALPTGSGTYTWDGTDGQGNKLPAGKYSFTVSGTDASGGTQTATTYTTGVADGVKFEDGAAYITIGPISVLYSDITSVHG